MLCITGPQKVGILNVKAHIRCEGDCEEKIESEEKEVGKTKKEPTKKKKENRRGAGRR